MATDRLFVAMGAALALAGVAAGAFGAHALRSRVAADLLSVFETGVRYQMYHAFGLLAVGLLASRWSAPQLTWAGWLFLAGTAIFSGSLYVLALTGTRWWGAITPFGGVLMLAGWVTLLWGAVAAK